MASIKDLKKRITSVKNTQQTTRAMKVVSAAKLRRAQEAITSQRPYAREIGGMIHRLSQMASAEFKSPLIQKDDEAGSSAKKKVLLVVVTSDRGLCGGFNGNVIKGAQKWVKAHADEYELIELAFLGRKGYEFFKSRKFAMGSYFSTLSGKVTLAKAKELSAVVCESYLSGHVDEVKFIFNEFKNAVTQEVVVENFLPLLDLEKRSEAATPTEAEPMYIVKPSIEEVLTELLNRNFSIQAFRIMLESQASEHGARMAAMENATKNAGEMIRDLTLEYNKQRQASITKELLEIISGSESQKAS